MIRKFGLFALMCAFAILAMPAHAAKDANFNELVSIQTFVPCANNGAGEVVVLNGYLHIEAHSTSNGHTLSSYIIFRPQNISGFGQTTATKNNAVGETNQMLKANPNNYNTVVSSVNNFKIIGQGPGNNFMVHENVHFTLSANGINSVSLDHWSITCQ